MNPARHALAEWVLYLDNDLFGDSPFDLQRFDERLRIGVPGLPDVEYLADMRALVTGVRPIWAFS